MKYSIQLLNCQHDCTYHLLWRLETFFYSHCWHFCKRLNHVWWHICISKGMFCVKVSVGSWLSWHKLITSAPSFYLMYWPKHVCNHLHGLLSSLSCNLSASCNLSVRALLADTFPKLKEIVWQRCQTGWGRRFWSPGKRLCLGD